MARVEPDPHLAGLARGGLLNLAGAISAGVFGVVLVTVVAAIYSPGVAGSFFAAISVFLILGAVCELGSDIGLVRWLARYLAQDRYGDIRACLQLAVIPVVAVGCLAAGAVFLAAPWIAQLINGGTPPGQITLMLRIMALFVPVAAVRNALLSATRGYGAMRPTVVVEKLGRTSAQVAGVLVAAWLGCGTTGLALAWSVPYLLGLLGAAWWLRVVTRRARGNRPGLREPPERQPSRTIAAEFWRYTGPRALAHICQIALQRADILLIAAVRSPQEAAIYTVATRFIVLGQLGAQAVQQVMQPAVSRLLTQEDRVVAARILRTATAWTVIATLPLYAAVAAMAPLYLTLVGDHYVLAGTTAVVILALAMMVATASGPVDGMLLMAGRSGLSLFNNAAALAVNLALNVVLIPALGVTGAAVAWAAAITVRNLLPLAQVRAVLAMSPLSSGAIRAAAAAVLCFGLVPLALRFAAGMDGIFLGLALIPCATAYGGLLWLVRDRVALTALARVLQRREGTPNTTGGFA